MKTQPTHPSKRRAQVTACGASSRAMHVRPHRFWTRFSAAQQCSSSAAGEQRPSRAHHPATQSRAHPERTRRLTPVYGTAPAAAATARGPRTKPRESAPSFCSEGLPVIQLTRHSSQEPDLMAFLNRRVSVLREKQTLLLLLLIRNTAVGSRLHRAVSAVRARAHPSAARRHEPPPQSCSVGQPNKPLAKCCPAETLQTVLRPDRRKMARTVLTRVCGFIRIPYQLPSSAATA